MRLGTGCVAFGVAVIWLASAPALSLGDNWPRFLGAGGLSATAETGLPTTWSATQNVKWKVALPGPGMSSPIVWGGKILLTQALDPGGRERALLCFDRKDGRELWRHVTLFEGKESTFDGEPHYCSASPVTDGQRVVASFASAGIVCTDMNGKLLWRRDLGKAEQIWGTASSPIIHGNLVILNFGPDEGTALVALDKRTGRDVWRVKIGGYYGTKPEEWIGSWSTPVVVKVAGREELIMTWPEFVKAYDPTTGKELWSCEGMGRLVYTSPLANSEVVLGLSGYGGPTMAVRPGGSGDVTTTHRLWRDEKGAQRIGSGVILGEHVYYPTEAGIVNCVEWKTGKVVWSERVTQQTWGSLVLAEGRLYMTSRRGETVVLAAKPVFEVLARNDISEKVTGSMAVSGGELFLRSDKGLWCIGSK